MRIVRISGLACLVMSVFCVDPNAWAQDYPTKPIRLVVPTATGGGVDITSRIIAQKLNEAWGQPVVVDNRAGGTGAIGSVMVARSRPDGYTLLMATSSYMAISPSLQGNLPYDPEKDFSPITLITTSPTVLVAHPSVPANSIKELVAFAKARPNSLNYAGSGVGTLDHMTGELFKMATGTEIVFVPYKGAGAVIPDLIGGYVQLMFSGPGSVIPHVRSHKLKALAVTSSNRTKGMEEVPTFAEAGYPAINAMQWYGMLTTAGTPKTVVDKLNREIVRIIQLPEVKEQFLASGFNPVSATPHEFAQLIKNDLTKWKSVVKASGIRPD